MEKDIQWEKKLKQLIKQCQYKVKIIILGQGSIKILKLYHLEENIMLLSIEELGQLYSIQNLQLDFSNLVNILNYLEK